MLLEGLRMPHAARQFENIAAVDMQAYSGCTADTFDDVRRVGAHTQDQAGRDSDLACLAELSILDAVERVLLLAGKKQNRCPRSVVMRWRAAPSGKANLEQCEVG